MKLLTYVGLCLIANYFPGCLSMCTPEYGPNPSCKYLPAPPGKTPLCAKPGFTYCEYPEHYPTELIYTLIQKWQFDHKTLIINEVRDDFNAIYFPPPTTIYGPPSFIQNHVVPSISGGGGGYQYPDPFYIPKPSHTHPEQGGSGSFYLPPPQRHNFSFGYPDYNKDGTFLTYKYTSNFPQGGATTAAGTPQLFAPPTYINDIWKRNERLKRSLRKSLDGWHHQKTNATMLVRNKRQSTITGQTLCRSRSNFIMPKAALNSKGNWMYVVNMPETNQQYTQLVKSEMCADTNCNGLCQLPQGYSSRCEQKYVQKRLIALEGSGSDLYSDTFWFPSCCICTISNS
ncbi:hypothetical protein ABEB36_011728 [Hypothenemus hampei]|uniref:Spaetzle domain-containing protein n=1 Tax=Hypothenemus hampei TaxID=57062 RepID=A0ABD1E927_HYPHA